MVSARRKSALHTSEMSETDPLVSEDGGDFDRHVLSRMTSRIRRHRMRIRVSQVAILILGVTAWEFLAGDRLSGEFALIDSYFISQPSAVVEALASWVDQGILIQHLIATIQVTMIGLALGVLSGMLVGFVLGVSPTLSAVLTPFLSLLYSIPRLALVPLFLIWFGLGLGPKLALVWVLLFFLVFYNTFSGVRDVDQQLVDVLRLMGASKWQIYRKVVLQSAMTWIVTGLRLAVPYALVGAVTSEMLTSNEGLGYLLIRSAGQFYTQGVFAAIAVMMGLALLLNGSVTLFERRVLHWKPRGDSGQDTTQAGL